MKFIEIILLIIKFALEVWRNRTDPDMAKVKAAAIATKELNSDIQSFDKALAANDASALSAHFEQLRKRVQLVSPSSSDPRR